MMTLRYWLASAWFEVGWWWLVLTGRAGDGEAPAWFERAYNAQAHAWNARENRR